MTVVRDPDNVVVRDADDRPVLVRFVVYGDPVAQGSKRHVGRGVMVESKKLKPWRQQIADEATALNLPTVSGPVEVEATFCLRRPKGHYGTGRNADLLKATAADYVATRPDIDKLSRALLDALKQAGVYRDDGQVAVLIAQKRYANRSGVRVTVRALA